MKSLSEKITEASDPCTDPDTLRELSEFSNKKLHCALALNPNTPEPVLRNLWTRHPDLILENPILALWEFSEPGQLPSKIGQRAMMALYNHQRRAGLPLREDLFSEDNLSELIDAAVRRDDPAVFEFIPLEENFRVRHQLIKACRHQGGFRFFHERASDEVWRRFATDPNPQSRLELAHLLRSGSIDLDSPRRDLLEEICHLLARDTREEVAEHLAHCRFLPADLVQRFSKAANPQTRSALARCILAPLSVLERFAEDDDDSVRLSLAKHCSVIAIQERLVRDRSEVVRKTLVENHALPLEILNRIDHSETLGVRRAAFRNQNADIALRSRLIQRCDPEFQQVILGMGKQLTPQFYFSNKDYFHPEILARFNEANGLHPSILDDLSRDSTPRVRIGVVKRLRRSDCRRSTPRNLELVYRLARDASSDVRLEICTDPRLNAESSAALLSDPSAVVRKKTMRAILGEFTTFRDRRYLGCYTALYRAKAPLLVKMATDPDHAVRIALAASQEAPPEALGILFDDAEEVVASEARVHDRWPFGVVLDLEKKHGTARKTFRHGNTTPNAEALQILSASKNPYLRQMVAKCARTKIAIIRKLADDPHPAVRSAASATLLKRAQ